MRKTILFLFLIAINSMIYSQQYGTISGKVTDIKTGEPMIGANIYLEGTTTGSSVDLEGNYIINNIIPGSYTLIGSFITYEQKKIEKVIIKANKLVVLNFTMQENQTELKEVVIQAKRTKSTENAILSMQKKSVAVQDGISLQEINKTGESNAAEAAKQITGISVVEGKYVYIRGLGDRYSAAQLNGASLIGTDPYINSVPLDLIPSNLLDNIITVKTFTPDQPGNFAGGIVNLTTTDIPEKLTLNFSNSISYNPQSSFNSNFLSYEGGKKDWLGYDDGTRVLPDILQNEDNITHISSPVFYIQASKNKDYANLLDDASNSLNSQMEALPQKSFTNYSTSFSFGNQYKLFKNPLGVIFGINYSKSYSFYDDGKNQAWDITGPSAPELFTYYNLKDQKSSENPVISNMAGVSYQITKNSEIGILNVYNHDTEKMSRYQIGKIPGIVSGGDKDFETRTLQFEERGINTTQIKGKHQLSKWNSTEIKWLGAATFSFQNEPDLRFFANENVGDSIYYISAAEYDLPNHYFRYLNDRAFEFKTDISIPLSKEESARENKLKVGFSSTSKKRSFQEYRFYYKNQKGKNYQGNQNAFFGTDNTGIIGYDSLYNKYIIGNYLLDNTKISNNYKGQKNITSFYGMGIFDISKNLKFSGGVRVEKTIMHVESADTTKDKGDINQYNFFPSLNFIYALNEKVNIRSSYSQTIARPTMRELAPFVTFDFIGGFLYLGNPDLKTTQIKNYDIRLEYFMSLGEVFAISAYYKNFINPIVKAYNTEAINPEIIYQNTNNANVYGIEIDIRKNLGIAHSSLENFKVNANFSYIISRVALDTSEYNLLAEINPEIDQHRPFQGQSPFLLNTVLSYFSPKLKGGADLSYNVFGKRLSSIGLNGLPDIYESPRGMMTLSVSKKLGKNLNLKLRVKNILNAKHLTIQTYKKQAYMNASYQLGRTYSFSISYYIK